jgi:hypothetical protein
MFKILSTYICWKRNIKCNIWRLGVRPSYILDARFLNLILRTWIIKWAPNNANKWQMGFNSAFKGLNVNYNFFFLFSHLVPSFHYSAFIPLCLRPRSLWFSYLRIPTLLLLFFIQCPPSLNLSLVICLTFLCLFLSHLYPCANFLLSLVPVVYVCFASNSLCFPFSLSTWDITR